MLHKTYVHSSYIVSFFFFAIDARIRDLLTMNEELKKARKAFDEIKYVQEQK